MFVRPADNVSNEVRSFYSTYSQARLLIPHTIFGSALTAELVEI